MSFLIELIAKVFSEIFKDGINHETTSENIKADPVKRDNLAKRLRLYFENKSDFR